MKNIKMKKISTRNILKKIFKGKSNKKVKKKVGKIKKVLKVKKIKKIIKPKIKKIISRKIKKKEEKNVEIKLTQRNFSYWSIDAKRWQIKEGSYEILIGSSSENIFLKSSINLEKVLQVL